MGSSDWTGIEADMAAGMIEEPTRRTGRFERDGLARRLAYARGLFAEGAAAWLLRLKGYRIIAWRYRTPLGEIDLVARRGGRLAFVEVKARAELRAGEEALSEEACRRIGAAADLFLARHPRLAGSEQRFDLMVVANGCWPVHLPGAFVPP